MNENAKGDYNGEKALSGREIELIDGMIEVQRAHAKRCDGIANIIMAEKQKGWDLERVALLEKVKALLDAEDKPSVPMEMLKDLKAEWINHYPGRTTENICARYGFQVKE